jgi:hypothetical protein
MNPLDDDLAKFFAADELGTYDAAFGAAVRRRIATHRFARKALALGFVAAAAAGAVGVATLVPGAALYPVQLLNELLGSPLVALTAIAGAVGVTWWTTFVEA